MNDESLDPMVDRLWSQMTYAYTSGGGHSGHLRNAAHTARLLSQELRRLNATATDLTDRNTQLSRQYADLKETIHHRLEGERQTYIDRVVELEETLRRYREREKVQGWAEL